MKHFATSLSPAPRASRNQIRLLAAVLTCAASLAAQSAPPPGEAEVVLTPFVVNTSKDQGYSAQNTLGGTRLNTALTDTAAPISVFTRELLDDIAATSIREANEYALNVVNDYGDSTLQLSTNGNSFAEVGEQEMRIRGLNRTTVALNYFESILPSDGYNLTRLDFARGPNSVLFGMGSPAGVINASTKQARVGGPEKTELRFRGDNNGGLRAELDRAGTLLPGRVAYRLNLLGEDRKTWRVNEEKVQHRGHASLHWKVNPRLSVRLEGEVGSGDQRQGRPWNQLDLLSQWESLGSQTLENVRPDGTFVSAGGFGGVGIGTISGTDRAYAVFESNQAARGYTQRQVGRPVAVSTDVQSSYPADTTFRTLPRDAQIGGDLVRGSLDFESVSAFVEVSPVRNLHLEFAANRQHRRRVVRDLDWPQYGLQVDVNRYEVLTGPGGARVANPKLLNYYFETDMWLRDQFNDARSARFMGSYELDLGRKFGRHRFGVLAERTLRESFNTNYREFVLDDPATAAVELMAVGARSGDNILRRRVYVNPADIGTNRPSMSGFSGNTDFTSENVFPLAITSNMAATTPVRQGRAIGDVVQMRSGFRPNGGSWGQNALNSGMAVVQSSFLQERLIAVVGLRQDEAQVRGSDNVSPTSGPNAGFLVPQLRATTAEKSGNTRTLGLVARPFRGVSLVYNRSTNFNVPTGTALVFNPDPAALTPDLLPPNERGESEDYGIKLDLFAGKLFFTATRYETSARNGLRNTGGAFYSSRVNTIWEGLAAAGVTLPAPLTTLNTNQNQVLFDAVADGYEFEAVANLTPGWRLMANYSNSKTVAANIATEMRGFIDRWRPLWSKYPNVPLAFPQTDQDTVAEMLERIDVGIKSDFLSQENNRQRGNSQHRANLRTSYRFARESVFKGFSIGGGARYRSAPITAHITLTDAAGRITRNDVIKGVDSFVTDFNLGYQTRIFRGKVGWHVQLNVNNLLDTQRLHITRSANDPTKPQYLGNTVLYRFEDPRTFILTNSFTF